MIDILILTTKKNTYKYYFYNDKIFETNISYNYHKNYYINNKEYWDKYKKKSIKNTFFNSKNNKILIEFN